MLNKSFACALVFAALPLAALTIESSASATTIPLGSATSETSAEDIAALLNARLSQVESSTGDQLWTEARSLRNAALLLESGDKLDAELDKLLPTGSSYIFGNSLLLAAATRLIGESPDLELLSERLQQVLAAEEPQVAASAAALLGQVAFRGLPTEERAELASALQARADDGDAEPELRVAASVAAYTVGRGMGKGKARSRLRSFLGSNDPLLRSQGALALAEIGDEVRGELEQELTTLSELPGDTGRLATSYLKIEARRKMHEGKYRKLQELYNTASVPEDLRRITSLMSMIRDGHIEGDRFTDEELIDAGLNGMLQTLDRHSSYLPPEDYKKFSMDLLEENYGGIGAYVRNDPVDNIFTITRPIYSGPAYKAGLATDDKIVQIDDWPTLTNETNDVIKRLKGKPGTIVKLYIWRRGMDPGLITRPTESMVVEIERAQISVPSTAFQMLPGKIGMVELKSFSRTATMDVGVAIEALMADGMQALIFDLRFNGGGLLSEARGVADLFLPKGLKVVTTEPRVGESQILTTRHAALIPEDMPLVCLVNRYSASASEIVSGALQDHERAPIIGERSFGKGSVQNLFPLYKYSDDQFVDENNNNKWDSWETLTRDFNNNGEFDFAPHVRLTIARYLLPSGRSIHREFDDEQNVINPGGVVPDVPSHAELIEGWRLVERRVLLTNQAPRNYVDEHWAAHHEEFVAFADCDEKNPALYPNFESFYTDLDTPLDRDDVRVLLRAEIRRRVQDDRGGAFPFGDFEEDVQVQDAVRNLLDSLGVKIDAYPSYATTFTATRNDDGSHVDPETVAAAEGANARNQSLADATKVLISAQGKDGSLTSAELAGLIEVLEGLTRDQ